MKREIKFQNKLTKPQLILLRSIADHFGVNVSDIEENFEEMEFFIYFYDKARISIEVVSKKHTGKKWNTLEIDYRPIINSNKFFRIL
jgi:hypothetical protein